MTQFRDAASGEEAAKDFINGVAGSVDDLDNVLYYLLNQYDAKFIRQRLRISAEVHPNEVARRVFGLPDSDESEIEEEAQDQRPFKSLTKVEQARRLLGG